MAPVIILVPGTMTLGVSGARTTVAMTGTRARAVTEAVVRFDPSSIVIIMAVVPRVITKIPVDPSALFHRALAVK